MRSGSARRHRPSRSPTRHCQIAECSESIGRSQASGLAYGSPGRASATSAASARASGMTRWPPATSVSLFAVATTLPARNAARTGRRLTTPPVATTTMSTSSRVASDSRASPPPTRSVPGGRSSAREPGAVAERDDRRAETLGLLGEERGVGTRRERDDREGVGMRGEDVDRLAADRSGRAEERNAARSPLAGPPGSAKEGKDIQRDDRCGEDERVDPVEHPAMARDQRPRILGIGGPLDDRLGQVAGLRGERRQWSEREGVDRRPGRDPRGGPRPRRWWR